jgi:copper chaperone NosL
MRRLLSLAGLALVAGCAAPGPRPIAYGQEQCGFCRMTVDDRRYAAEVITTTGKVHTFDSIECLAAYVGGADAGAVRGAWVHDVTRPGALVSVDSVRFWQLGGSVSPMGKGLVATVAATPPAAGARGPMDWAAVRALVAREGMSADAR